MLIFQTEEMHCNTQFTLQLALRALVKAEVVSRLSSEWGRHFAKSMHTKYTLYRQILLCMQTLHYNCYPIH